MKSSGDFTKEKEKERRTRRMDYTRSTLKTVGKVTDNAILCDVSGLELNLT